MSTFDSAIIKAFFTEEEIREAQTLSAQSALTESAAGAYRLTVADFEVQVDGFTFPGCTSCACEDFRERKSCAHVCFGVATMLAEHPSIKDVLWPDSSAASNSDLLEPDSYYELKMLPFTYSPSCQAGLSFAETVLGKVQQCHGEVANEKIAEEVKRLFDDYFEQSETWGHDVSEAEIKALIFLLRNLRVSDKEIRALVGQHPEYSRMIAWRWWPWSWWKSMLLPRNRWPREWRPRNW